MQEYRPRLAKYCVDAVAFMKDAQDRNNNILVEGANALMVGNPVHVDVGDIARYSSNKTR